MVCINCGIETPQLWGKGNKYCSKSCQAKYANTYIKGTKIIKCSSCNKKLEVHLKNRKIFFCELCKVEFENKKKLSSFKSGICETCDNEHNGSYATGRFCSKSCASFFSSKNDNKKDTKKCKCIKCSCDVIVNKRYSTKKTLCVRCKFYNKICKGCNIQFNTKNKEKLYCSKECLSKIKRINTLKNLNYKKLYYKLSEFNFSLKMFPNEFDLSLIDKYGMYRAKNNGDNPNGIVRDHMISKKYGFDNLINPFIIAHPANCNLLFGNVNREKNINCSISLDELILKINQWDFKYGNFYKFPLLDIIHLKNL